MASSAVLSIQDYQVPLKDRPTLKHNAYDVRSDSIPCIDLSSFNGLEGESRKVKLEEMRKGIVEWDFFQVCGHSIDKELIKGVMEWAVKIFKLPDEVKRKAAVSMGSSSGYVFGSTASVKIWQESINSSADPEDFKTVAEKLWSENEELGKSLRDFHYRFSIAMEKLALDILKLLEEALGVRSMGYSEMSERMKRTFIRMTHYPACERPDLVLGGTSHTDPSLITILLQDDVGGLQILNKGEWIACRPRSGCFMVNIGDCLQVLSNDIFPSVQHRVTVNKFNSRYSIGAFAFPKIGTTMSPLPELVNDEHHAKFKAMTFEELLYASRDISYHGKEILSVFRTT